MAKYNVYGLGNALVDMEFEVAVEFLEQWQIPKGVMTLMDEQQQKQVLEHLGNLPSKQSSGGSAANTVVAVSQLGKSFYSCKVANDESGTFYLKDLQRCGVDSNLHNGDRPEGITGKCLVMVTPDADRTMNTFLGITGTLSEKELVESALVDSQYLYMEGYLVTSDTAKAAALKARNLAQAQGVKVALSLSDANMVDFFQAGLLEIIGNGVDFIFANEIESLKMAKTQNLSDAIAYLKTLSTSFAITRGAQGSLIFDGNELLEIQAVPVKAVDTVGAGDMYAGAFLYGITHNLSYQEAGNLASKAAGLIVSRFGPRLETEELRTVLS